MVAKVVRKIKHNNNPRVERVNNVKVFDGLFTLKGKVTNFLVI